jgi:diguanylate cyclase (GGDEF)-like protein/PAS domain S-box-containing protein
MVRKPAKIRAWASWSGVALTVIAAVLLAFALWQVYRLGRTGGLDPRTVAKERIALRAGADTTATLYAIASFRDVASLGAPPMAVRALRSAVDARMRSLAVLFDRGPAAFLDPGHDFDKTEALWIKARRQTGWNSIEPLRATTFNLMNVLADCQTNSGFAFDQLPSVQNFALLAYQLVPPGYEMTARMRVVSELAQRTGGMTLPQRISLASAVEAAKANFDLAYQGVDLAGIAREFSRIAPDRAALFRRLVPVGNSWSRNGKQFAALIGKQVLPVERPSLSPERIDRLADAILAQTRLFGSQVMQALAATVDARARLYVVRRAYVYASLLLGILLVLGIALSALQYAARHSAKALERAREESERLSNELARQKAEEALRLSEAQFKAVFDGAAIGIAVLDRSGQIADANSVFRSLFGDSVAAALDGHEQELHELLAGERETFEYEQHLRTALGQEVWTDATVSVVSDADGTPLFAICMFRDKTELKHSERRMLHDKTHDSLTGLPNRWLFEEHLRRRFEEASALLDSFFAVLFVDLEHFRDINESLGHSAGDSVLTQVAQRLRSSVDARDVVARLGSDEFAILLQSLGDILHVESVARRVLNNLGKAVTVNGRTFYMGASVGIAIGSASYERAEDVMRDAEIAMQHAKTGGGSRYALFDSKMQERAQKRLALTSDIRQALERNELRLLYQPIVSIVDGTPIGCEALLRWDHPAEGVMSPTEFMPIAEQTGLATPIGRFVVNTACEQLSQWRRNRNGRIDFTMHVNVSAAELEDLDFERALAQAIERHGLAPEDLTLEITESIVLDTGTRANVTLERIRDRGFRICIDDFGTGYSSLRYLQQFKVDAIKIDRGFVAGSDGELASEPIVRTLMTLAEAFDVRVVAEGVETVRQREVLRSAGCRYAQGFLYARPISAAELVALYPETLGRSPRIATA